MHRRKHGREYYAIPGGQVEKGETPKQAAVREVKEETNLDIEAGKLLLSYEREIYSDNGVAEYHEKSGGKIREYFFLADNISGKEQLGGPELERLSDDNFYELEWIGLEKIKDIELLPQRAKEMIIKSYLA